MQQRFRIDERWQQKFENREKTDVYVYSTRLRYFFGVHIPVFKNPMLPGLLVSDEVLIQFGQSIVYNPFSQNRLNIGIRQKVSEENVIDLTYINIYQQNSSGYQYDLKNTLRLFWFYTPDIRKKKTPPHMNVVERVH